MTNGVAGTIAYYDKHADSFIADTIGLDMSAIYNRFLSHVPVGGLLLDAGCGSGRDAKAFLERGYAVRAFDASAKLAARASSLIGQPVSILRLEKFESAPIFDGIWACASLLHLPELEIPASISRLWAALKPTGTLYLSFKYGNGERIDRGRHFTDANEERVVKWLAELTDVESHTLWTTQDIRPERQEVWLNAIVRRCAAVANRLITGEKSNPLLPQLSAAIASAAEIDLAVAFIKTTGLRLLLQDLHSALNPEEQRNRPRARLRVLTSDYLDVTDPEALRLLLLLKEEGAQVRVFEAGAISFHLKAYMFARFDTPKGFCGTAFVGSSNISRVALMEGLEWNYRIDYPSDPGFHEVRARFEELFHDPRTHELTDAWIESYEARRVPALRIITPGADEREAIPLPSAIQAEALQALQTTRAQGYRRGLVVLATGLGKTWLAAFDVDNSAARRVLFVAHREEILYQAAETFLRIRPHSRVGFYTGTRRDEAVDVLCASVQTLGRRQHLESFQPQHFDYIVVDEFHHAAAATYRGLLTYFEPRFLLGLTATPDRTDQSDILSLCDDNLVFNRNLFDGVSANLLVPFEYYGIWDETVDYREIPWRNGKFDPELLTNKLATLARARHALDQWRAHRQTRTLAFCISTKHAEYMADQFRRAGVRASAVYSGSELGRSAALEQLSAGLLEVIFSVDLFNEGVDLPAIDTVLMLRPTDSKILFLQQLGRGLRRAEGKEKLVVLDFIGNHQSFLHKIQVLGQTGVTYGELAAFAQDVTEGRLQLPAGCFLNFDLRVIEFLKSLNSDGAKADYEALKAVLGRRPTLSEFYRAGSSVQRVQSQYGSWFSFVAECGGLQSDEELAFRAHVDFLSELEKTRLTKSFKLVLLEAFQELDGWRSAPNLTQLAYRSWHVLQRRRPLASDLSEEFSSSEDGRSAQWERYWRRNPINAWIGGNLDRVGPNFFQVDEDRFEPTFRVLPENADMLTNLVQEVVDYRLAGYEVRLSGAVNASSPGNVPQTLQNRVELAYFPDLPMACGHFKSGTADSEEHRSLGSSYGKLNPARHFIARASGNSMNGGPYPIHDGDFLLMELANSEKFDAYLNGIVAVERRLGADENEYLLRQVIRSGDGRSILRALNSDYADLNVTNDMCPVAKFCAIIDRLELAVGQTFMREDIPPLFGEKFNPGSWNSGHVVLHDQKAHVLLVTLNKQGKRQDQRYIDHWMNETQFHWQSQNATTSRSRRGQEIINHEKLGIALHLFVREVKLAGGKAAPFVYFGKARYVRHSGDAPMSVVLEL